MKKILTVLMTLALVATASAWGHGDGHDGWREHNGQGWHNNNGNGGWGGNIPATVSTEDAAKSIVQDFFNANNMKGYTIGSASAYDAGNGMNMFIVNTTDSSGNAAVFHVSPYGQLRGPIFNN